MSARTSCSGVFNGDPSNNRSPILARIEGLGVTCIEFITVAEFAGRWSWGYDGVDLFAPLHYYGTPDDLRKLVNHAHSLGRGVILDVVYNHVADDGNYLASFSKDDFTSEHGSEWGQTFNYDCEAVRRLAIDNAAYWIRGFRSTLTPLRSPVKLLKS